MTYPDRGRRHGGGRTLARALGWFSIGLGLAELAAPREIGRRAGLGEQEGLLKAYGLREIATGLGLIAARDPKPWVWARLAGDAADIATVAAGSTQRQSARPDGAAALAALGGIMLIDLYCARRLNRPPRRRPQSVPDYSGRSGFPRPIEEMRGAARLEMTNGAGRTGITRDGAI